MGLRNLKKEKMMKIRSDKTGCFFGDERVFRLPHKPFKTQKVNEIYNVNQEGINYYYYSRKATEKDIQNGITDNEFATIQGYIIADKITGEVLFMCDTLNELEDFLVSVHYGLYE